MSVSVSVRARVVLPLVVVVAVWVRPRSVIALPTEKVLDVVPELPGLQVLALVVLGAAVVVRTVSACLLVVAVFMGVGLVVAVRLARFEVGNVLFETPGS